MDKRTFLKLSDELPAILRVGIEMYQHLPEWTDRVGGAFCGTSGGPYFGDIFEPKIVLADPSTLLHEQKVGKYLFNALEKTTRLKQRPNDSSSFQSRDDDATPPRYPGAVRVYGEILAFSGLPWPGDEAAMLILAEKHLGPHDDLLREIFHIVELSENTYWELWRHKFFRKE